MTTQANFFSKLAIPALILLAGATNAQAQISPSPKSIFRSPSGSDPASSEVLAVRDQPVWLNQAGNIVHVDGGWSSLTQIYMDPTAGVIKGLAGIDLPQPVALTDNAIGSAAIGTLGGMATLIGQGSTPVDVTFELAFDGRFQLTSGAPYLGLTGSIFAMSSSGASSSSTLSFLTSGDIAKPTHIQVEKYQSYLPVTTGGQTTYEPDPVTVPTVISAVPDLLSGVVRAHLLMMPGQTVSVGGTLTGIAYATGDTQFDPGAGLVNFLDTGTLRIVVPEGYSLTSTDPMFARVTTAVPEPASWQCLLTGLFTLGVMGVRKRASQSQ